MKRCWLFAIFSVLLNITYAQTVSEAGKLMYYERYQRAAEMLRNILRNDVHNGEAWWLLTRCYLRDDKLNSSRDSISPVPADMTGLPFIECARGDYMLRKGKKDSALLYLNSALEKTKQKDPVILAAVALAHLDADSGDASLAADLLKKAIRRDKSNAMYWVYLGNVFRKQADGAEVYKAYNKAIELDARNAEAMYRLGKLFETQHNPDMYIKYYIQAITNDTAYAPAWYALYYHDYFRNPAEALNYLQHFIATSDPDPENDYRVTDLLYLSGQYSAAIKKAEELLAPPGKSSKDARLYKLVAYSYNGMKDSVNALKYMDQFFKTEADSLLIQKDFESMGDMLAHFPEKADSAALMYGRAADMEKDSAKRTAFYKTIAGLFKKAGDYKNQAIWLGRYYHSTAQPTNIDLFNWGIADYLAGNYQEADTIFSRYIEKYPEQTFGYYWRARSDAAIDTAMQSGLAVTNYEKLVGLIIKDSLEKQNKKWLIEAYGYLAAYQANTLKDYESAMDNLEKVLALEPENENAKKYIGILKRDYRVRTTSKNK
jgi:tetratricopeptide (TPR) repeat protein